MANVVPAVTAIVLGVGGVLVLFWGLNFIVDRLPQRAATILRPYVFIGPALLVVSVFLLYPTVLSVQQSFMDRLSQEFVGLDNYQFVLGNNEFRDSLFNNFLWILVVPAGAVAIGLLVAVLADRLRPRWENVSKSLIFMPMAISFVGASTIWLFMYAWRPEGADQIGLISAMWAAVSGSVMDTPIVQNQTLRLNSFSLMAVMIWLQSGFAMVLLSAAIKNVPEDTIEAARIDGATELQIFWRVTVPQIRSTIVVVGTTILILVLKIFDIVQVMTSGLFNTNVIANYYYQLFTVREQGRAAVTVVALIVLTLPFMYINIKRFREQEATR